MGVIWSGSVQQLLRTAYVFPGTGDSAFILAHVHTDMSVWYDFSITQQLKARLNRYRSKMFPSLHQQGPAGR